jgi:predicted nucleotidyltransferase
MFSKEEAIQLCLDAKVNFYAFNNNEKRLYFRGILPNDAQVYCVVDYSQLEPMWREVEMNCDEVVNFKDLVIDRCVVFEKPGLVQCAVHFNGDDLYQYEHQK